MWSDVLGCLLPIEFQRNRYEELQNNGQHRLRSVRYRWPLFSHKTWLHHKWLVKFEYIHVFVVVTKFNYSVWAPEFKDIVCKPCVSLSTTTWLQALLHKNVSPSQCGMCVCMSSWRCSPGYPPWLHKQQAGSPQPAISDCWKQNS